MKTKTIIQASILIILVVVLIFLLTGSTFSEINADEFETLIESENVFVINTHTPYVGEIKNTDLIAEQWDDMSLYLDKLPEDKSTPIAVYCRSGNMATTSSQQLIDLGYTNVYNLEGGMNSWQESGRELIDNSQKTGEIKEFDIIASNWQFAPNSIEVNKGDMVILRVESIDTYHGIALLDFGISQQLPPGEIVDIEFLANKKGIFSFFCSVPCGHGHGSMGGQLIIN